MDNVLNQQSPKELRRMLELVETEKKITKLKLAQLHARMAELKAEEEHLLHLLGTEYPVEIEGTNPISYPTLVVRDGQLLHPGNTVAYKAVG